MKKQKLSAKKQLLVAVEKIRRLESGALRGAAGGFILPPSGDDCDWGPDEPCKTTKLMCSPSAGQ